MAAPKKYPDELRERATRLAVEARGIRVRASRRSGGVTGVGEAGRDQRRGRAGSDVAGGGQPPQLSDAELVG